MNIQFRVMAVGLIAAARAFAQEPMAQPTAQPMIAPRGEVGAAERHHGGMTESNFFCPELVMRFQKELGLSPDQQSALKSEMMSLASHVTDLRWQESVEKGALADLLKEAKPDEKAILAEKEKVLRIEDDLKLSTLATLVRIKNALTPEQQEKMTELQRHMEDHLWRGHMMRHPMPHPMMRHDMGFGGPPPANPW
jgi:Spy/CpxP family protein refolding chaperone